MKILDAAIRLLCRNGLHNWGPWKPIGCMLVEKGSNAKPCMFENRRCKAEGCNGSETRTVPWSNAMLEQLVDSPGFPIRRSR